jgi:hypothetical protein
VTRVEELSAQLNAAEKREQGEPSGRLAQPTDDPNRSLARSLG